MKYYNQEDFVYKVLRMRLSEKQMANVMYAVVITKAKITSSLGIGVYDYTRKQNSHNCVSLMIALHPEQIALFEELSQIKLEQPEILKLNYL